jgi:hypothetical protein
VSGYRERLFKFVESQSVELSFSERIAPAKGLSHGGKITLLAGMQPAEEFSTLVHEIAHEMLHRGDRRTLTTKQVRETEAEAVAFVVCQSVGLQNGTSSQDYVVVAVMLWWRLEDPSLLGFRPAEHNISEAVALPCSV